MASPFVPADCDEFVVEASDDGRIEGARGTVLRVWDTHMVAAFFDGGVVSALTHGQTLRIRFAGSAGTFTGYCSVDGQHNLRRRIVHLSLPADVTPAQRREFNRVPLAWPCRIRVPAGPWEPVQIVDLSLVGARVCDGGAWQSGDPILLAVTLPGTVVPLEVAGTVVRVEPGRPMRLGVAFGAMSGEQKTRIVRALFAEERRRAGELAGVL